MAGVRPRRMLFIGYVSCSLLAAAAAIPLMAQVGTGDANTGGNYTLASIAAAVIGGASLFGGRGTMFGTFIGIFIPTFLQNGLNIIHVNQYWQYVATAIVLVAAVYLDQLRLRLRNRG